MRNNRSLHSQKSTSPDWRMRPLLAAAAILLSAGIPVAQATEISLTEQPVAPARDYNIRLFENLRLQFTGSVEGLYDDNVDTRPNNEEESFALVPRLTMAIDWPITPRIHIGSGVSVGYYYYFNDEVDDTFVVGFDDEVGTNMNVDFFLGNGTLRLSERFSREISVLQVNTDNDYALSRNYLSAKYDVAVNPYIKLSVMGARRDTWTNRDLYEYQDNAEHSLDAVALWQTNPQLQLGPYVRWDNTDYDLATNNDRQTYATGASFVYQPRGGVRFQGSLGYELMDVDVSNPGARDEEDGWVGNLSCRFATSEYLSHYLGIRYDRDQDLVETTVNYSEETEYEYAVEWDVHTDVTINGDLAFLTIDEPAGGEDADIWRLGLGTSYQLNRKSKVSLRYDWRDRDSSVPAQSYERNRYSVKLTHRF